MVGIQNITSNITIQELTNMTNVTNPAELLININNTVYDGWFYFIMLWVAWIILFISAQRLANQPLHNAMYSGAFVTIISLILRAIYVSNDGIVTGMLTDFQFWMFPLITIVLAGIAWALKDS